MAAAALRHTLRMVHALSEGLMFGHFMTPGLIDHELGACAFEALAGEAASP